MPEVRDAEFLAEAGQGRFRRRNPRRIRREETAPLGFEDAARPAHAGLREERRGEAVLGRLSGMKALGHRAVVEKGPDAAREGAGDAERIGEALGIERSSFAAAAAAPKLPQVPVECQPFSLCGR